MPVQFVFELLHSGPVGQIPCEWSDRGTQLEDDDPVSCSIAVNQCQRVLMDAGLAVPPWDELAHTHKGRKRAFSA